MTNSQEILVEIGAFTALIGACLLVTFIFVSFVLIWSDYYKLFSIIQRVRDLEDKEYQLNKRVGNLEP